MSAQESKGQFVSWKHRRAWMVTDEFRVTGARYAAVRPLVKDKVQPDQLLGGLDAALTWAREQSNAKLGQPPLDATGQPDLHPADSGCFWVRGTAGGVVFVVEGPYDSRGELPDWESVRYRVRRDVAGEPGLVELVAEE
jgi:hypothetical protein